MRKASTIFIFLLIGTNLFLILRLSALNSSITDLNDDREIKIKEFYNTFRSAHIDRLPEDVYVTDNSGNKILLKNLTAAGSKLIFKFSETNCSKCIETALPRLNALADVIGAENIIFIASFSGTNDLRIYNQVNKIRFSSYTLPDTFDHYFEAAGNVGVPYLFVIDKDLNTKMMFFSEKMDTEAQRLYYQLVKDEFLANAIQRLTITPIQHDFHDVARGTTSRCDFQIRNNSGEAIVIQRIEASCECTKADWESSPLLPGHQSTIKVSFEAKEPGEFIRVLTMYFDHGSPMECRIKGRVLDITAK